jgi:hypothetical protein
MGARPSLRPNAASLGFFVFQAEEKLHVCYRSNQRRRRVTTLL